MGVDYYNCADCEEIFSDAGRWGHCGNCEATLCGKCYDKAQEKHGELGEGHPKAGWYGENAPNKCGCCDDSKPEMVAITKAEYESLLDDADKLAKLEAYGVDNWSGYSDALSDSEGIFDKE
jgi:hypothetical protein